MLFIKMEFFQKVNMNMFAKSRASNFQFEGSLLYLELKRLCYNRVIVYNEVALVTRSHLVNTSLLK